MPPQDYDDDRARDLRAGIERRLTSLEKHSIPQLTGCNGPLDLHADLVDEIRQDAQVIDSQLEELSLLAEEAAAEQLRASLLQAVDFLSARLSRARVRAREEALKSKRRIDSSTATSQRDALLGPSRGSHRAAPTPTGSTSKDDELMNATANVTDGLRRTRQLLEQELERSSLSTQMLERSSQTLTLTSDQYTTFSGLLNASKSLITTMQKADTLDRLLILAALLFFGLVCLLIVKRRIIDRGIRAATLFSRIAGVGSSASIRSSLSSSASLLASTVTTREVTAKASPVVTITGPTLISHILTSANIASAAVATALSPSLPSALSSQAHWTTDTISSTTLEQQSASISTELTGQSHDSVRSAATANVETRMVDVGGDMHSYSEHVVDEL